MAARRKTGIIAARQQRWNAATMTAPKKNKYWKVRRSHGRRPIFENPETLWEACAEYFEWIDDNPLYAVELVKFQGRAKQHKVPKMRAMTIEGLCAFLGIGRQTWFDYCSRQDFSDVTTRVREIMYVQKFEGAAADMLNANIIARDLGLADKVESAHSFHKIDDPIAHAARLAEMVINDASGIGD